MSKPQMGSNEAEIKTIRANRTQGSRAVGGHLMLTNHRLVFYPHKFDDATVGDSWECALGSIKSAGIADRSWNPFNGSLRRRLEIDPGGPHQFFVVSRVEEIVAEIERAISSS